MREEGGGRMEDGGRRKEEGGWSSEEGGGRREKEGGRRKRCKIVLSLGREAHSGQKLCSRPDGKHILAKSVKHCSILEGVQGGVITDGRTDGQKDGQTDN